MQQVKQEGVRRAGNPAGLSAGVDQRASESPGAAPPAGADPRSATAVNALVHLYRAEVGRLTAYRTRLDTTTSWAITTSALVATFAYGNQQNPAAAFLFLMLCDYFFLHLEARRFIAYEASRYRVHLLERCFYGEVLGAEGDSQWAARLLEALRNPSPTISPFGAVGWRLRRNYLWIFALVLLAWIGKLHLAGPPSWDPGTLAARARVGDIPAWLVIVGVGAFYVYLLLVTAAAHHVYPRGDEDARHMEEGLAVQ
ncbi:MAG TPA: DUF2270 domain-containing protein [Chloroflexota bacterium]|nr:DUF2270 domain-containing protein [Chloroflexota bacterium]